MHEHKEEIKEERPFTAAVITLSDKGARGERVDESGPAAAQMLQDAGYEILETLILPAAMLPSATHWPCVNERPEAFSTAWPTV